MSNWISGSLIVTFYIKSIQTYLGISSKFLNFLAIPPMLSAVGAFIIEILFLFFDINLRLDPEFPVVEYNNIFMAYAGGFNPHIAVKSLVPLFLIPSAVAIIIFFKHVFQKGQAFSLLSLGMCLSLVGILIDGTMGLDDGRFRLMPPILFLSNFFEIMRITYSNQVRIGKHIEGLESDLVQTHKLAQAGDYFARLSHDLANPVYAARSYVELILNKVPKDEMTPNIQRYQDNIESQFNHIEGLLNNVKDLTRPSSDWMKKPEKVSSIIETVLGMLQIKAYHAGVEVRMKEMDEVTVHCNRDQVIQVLGNLINNSIEAVQENKGWVKVSAREEENGALISVTDSGPGIPKELEDKIFQSRFSTKGEKGNGLGLSICHRIVENHKGKIYLNSKSENTQFVVWLPLS